MRRYTHDLDLVESVTPETPVLKRRRSWDWQIMSGDTLRLPRWPWTAVLAVVVGLVPIAAHAAVYGRWIVDDAGITFAYARTISDGYGPVLQPGADPVEGYSNPLWLVLLVLGRLIGLFDRGDLLGIPDYVVFPKMVAMLGCAGILSTVHWASTRITQHAWAITVMTGAGLAALPSFVIWSFSGLENSLYAMLVTLLAGLLCRSHLDRSVLSTRVALLSGTVVFLAAVTRPDGAIYAAAYPLVALLSLRKGAQLGAIARGSALSGLALAVPYGAFIAGRWLAFGRVVPNTAAAKSQAIPHLENAQRVFELAAAVGGVTTIAAAVCVLLTLSGASRMRTAIIPPLIVLALAMCAYCVLPADWMTQYRFATPVWTMSVWLVALSVVQSMQSPHRLTRFTTTAAVLIGGIGALEHSYANMQAFRAAPTVPLCQVADQYGRAVNRYSDILGIHSGTMLVPDLGGTAMTTEFKLVDLAGLADRTMANYYAAGDMAGLRNYIFGMVRPTVIHTHGNWSKQTGVTTDSRLARDYTEVFNNPATTETGWVRKDQIHNSGELASLRAYAKTTLGNVGAQGDRTPRRSCGPTLDPGQRLQ